MIIETSAIVVILREEPERRSFVGAIERAASRRMSAASYVEAAIVTDANRQPLLSRRLDDLVQRFRVIIEPVTEEQTRIARQAYRDFGKGSGHPAQLNFGDCFAYALAKVTGEPLLFKGDDFIHTDLAPAT